MKEPKRSILEGKREVMKLNGHEVVVIVPDKVDFESGKAKLKKLLKGFD